MNDLQLQLVTFGQAKRLKAAGFNWPCFDYYNANTQQLRWQKSTADFPHYHNRRDDSFSAPSVALALKWARDVKGIYCGITSIMQHYAFFLEGHDGWCIGFDNHDSAESALLDAVLGELEKDFPAADERPVIPANPE